MTSALSTADRVGRREAPVDQLVAQLEQVDLPHRFAVHERRRPPGLRNALDFHASPAAHRDVDVLAAGAHTHAHVPRAAAHAADEQDRLGHLVRRAQVGAGHRLDQRHAEAVRAPHDEVTAVRHLAARILFDAHLEDGQLAPAERQAAVDADNGGALEPGGDRAVEVLLPRDVDFVDDVAAEHQALLDGDVHRVLVDEEGRRVIHLVRADVLLVQQVDDVLPGLELHQRRAVVLAELGQRRAHVAQHLAVVRVGVAARRAMAEHLALGEQLLVDFEAGDEADFGVEFGRLVQRAVLRLRGRRGVLPERGRGTAESASPANVQVYLKVTDA